MATDPAPPRPRYRPAKPLPYELREHCIIYLEEELYSAAFSLLSSLLTAGAATHLAPAFVPPSPLLALAATLAVHPSLTTHTAAPDRHAAAAAALRLLRQVLAQVGPVGARLGAAFAFAAHGAGGSRRDRRRRRPRDDGGGGGGETDGGEGDGDGDGGVAVQTPLARAGALWARKAGFWDVLGWALNCAAVHPARWARWRPWLAYMLDVLEADWDERVRMTAEAEAKPKPTPGSGQEPDAKLREKRTNDDDDGADDEGRAGRVLEGSIVAAYLAETEAGGRTAKRRIMRAVFTDGSARALAEFGEVWKGETRGVIVGVSESGDVLRAGAGDEMARKRRRLDLEKGEWGEWGDEEEGENDENDGQEEEEEDEEKADVEEGGEQAVKRRRRAGSGARGTPPVAEAADDSGVGRGGALEAFGGIEALELRRRILVLLTRVADALPTQFMRSDELLDLYVEFMRPLPLAVFSFFVMPSMPPTTVSPNDAGKERNHRHHHFSHDRLTYLHRNLLIPILAAPSLPKDSVPLTARLLATAYLPFAANSTSVADNARASLVLEALLKGLWKPGGGGGGVAGGGAQGLAELRRAVVVGIEARRVKAAGTAKRRKGGKGGEEREREEREWLEFSGARMLVVLDMLEG